MLPDDGDRLGWSDVVARLPVVFAGEGIEMFGDELLATRESVAAAHMKIMATNASSSECRQHCNLLQKAARKLPACSVSVP